MPFLSSGQTRTGAPGSTSGTPLYVPNNGSGIAGVSNINSATGNVSLTASDTALTVVNTSSSITLGTTGNVIPCASVVASGNVGGNTVSAVGAVSAGSVVASGGVSAGTTLTVGSTATFNGGLTSQTRLAGTSLGLLSSGVLSAGSAVAVGALIPLTALNTYLNSSPAPAVILITIWCKDGTSTAGLPFGTVQVISGGNSAAYNISFINDETQGFVAFTSTGTLQGGNLVITTQNASGNVMPTVEYTYTIL